MTNQSSAVDASTGQVEPEYYTLKLVAKQSPEDDVAIGEGLTWFFDIKSEFEQSVTLASNLGLQFEVGSAELLPAGEIVTCFMEFEEHTWENVETVGMPQ